MSSHQLQLALDKFHSEQPNTRIEVKVHPFLLDPTASNDPKPVQEVMAAKFGEQKAGEIRGMMKGKFEAMGLELYVRS
jgi:predicted DsbA family dithiol-disulfide isomerase